MIFENGKQKAESGRRPRRSRCAAIFRFPPSAFRLGLTLIELLITITILATLAGVFLGVSGAAMESARSARTKTTISKIHTLLMERWESYSTRRVELNPDVLNEINVAFPVGDPDRGNALADVRVLALRELMKLEMPDRWSDVDLSQYSGMRSFLGNVPAITRAYDRRRISALQVTNGGDITLNESAECLFLVVMFHSGDGEARTLFSRQDIGDTDGDGAQEFLDGWGRPIRWIRWPSGFVDRSDLITSHPENPRTGLPETDHDPFDPFHRNARGATPDSSRYPSLLQPYIAHLRGTASYSPPFTGNPETSFQIGYRLVPLVFSMGSDGIGDMSTRSDYILQSGSSGRQVWLDPYAWDRDNDTYQFGAHWDNPANPDGDDNSLDNIHNHLLDGS